MDGSEEAASVLGGVPVQGWPGILGDIARIAGDHAAEAFAFAFGDRDFHVPKAAWLWPGHPMVKALGMEAAKRVSAELSGSRHTVPSGRWTLSHHRVKVLWFAGWAVPEISQALQMRRGTVERHVEGLAPENRGEPRRVRLRCATCGRPHTLDPADFLRTAGSKADRAEDLGDEDEPPSLSATDPATANTDGGGADMSQPKPGRKRREWMAPGG